MILTRRKTVQGLVAFSIRVEPETKQKLEELAYKKRQSLGKTVGEILEAAVSNKVEPVDNADNT